MVTVANYLYKKTTVGPVYFGLPGVHAASRQLRHADIAITNLFYTDARKRALTGLGHLLKSGDKVVLLPQDQGGPSRRADSLALGWS